MGFDPGFSRKIVLPLAAAAYGVYRDPATKPTLPSTFAMTALLQADESVLAVLSGTQEKFARALIGPGPVFGLVGHDVASKTAFVSFRGTLTLYEWLDDFDFDVAHYSLVTNFGDVHAGWNGLYLTIRPSLLQTLPAACEGCDQLIVTGHSLGAALAVLAAPDIAVNLAPQLEPKLVTFGGPKAGLRNFVQAFNIHIASCFRIVNLFDPVPHLPLEFPLHPYSHVGVEVPVDSGGPFNPVDRHLLPAYQQGLDRLGS